MTPGRFAKGMTFDEYLKFIGSPENLAREGWDIRRFSTCRPRVDWSGYLRERHTKARLGDEQAAAITWLAAQPGGPARVLVIAEDWSSDCRRDLPYLARLAEAGGLELRLFLRDAETMHGKGLPEPGQKFATIPVAVFFTREFTELYRYIEYPAIYHKDLMYGALRRARPGETEEQTKARAGREIGALFESPLFDVWACAGVAEIVSALHERLVVG